MTKDLPFTLVTSECPGCKKNVQVTCVADETGLLHPFPLTASELVAHCNCDLWSLMRAISLSALHQSKVTTYKIVKGEGYE